MPSKKNLKPVAIDRVSVSSVITVWRKDKILKLVEEGKYMSPSDFIRQAIREKLVKGED